MEANRALKRQKQQKSTQLRQLATEGRANMGNKFNKVLLAMLASRMRQDANRGKQQTENQLGGINEMQKIIAHIMGASPPRPFSDYLQDTEMLFNSGAPCNTVKEE